jgi:hypothetical protein
MRNQYRTKQASHHSDFHLPSDVEKELSEIKFKTHEEAKIETLEQPEEVEEEVGWRQLRNPESKEVSPETLHEKKKSIVGDQLTTQFPPVKRTKLKPSRSQKNLSQASSTKNSCYLQQDHLIQIQSYFSEGEVQLSLRQKTRNTPKAKRRPKKLREIRPRT